MACFTACHMSLPTTTSIYIKHILNWPLEGRQPLGCPSALPCTSTPSGFHSEGEGNIKDWDALSLHLQNSLQWVYDWSRCEQDCERACSCSGLHNQLLILRETGVQHLCVQPAGSGHALQEAHFSSLNWALFDSSFWGIAPEVSPSISL